MAQAEVTEVPQLREEDLEDEEDSVFKEEEEEEKKEELLEDSRLALQTPEIKEGAFIYSLHLSEINSEELKKKVEELLDEDYLDLNLEERIENGEIVIDKISPVSTYLIVNQLMGLPIKITWHQKSTLD